MTDDAPRSRAGVVRQGPNGPVAAIPPREGDPPEVAEEAPAEPEIAWGQLLLSLQWRNLFSMRVWFGAMLLGAIPGALVAQLWNPLGVVVAMLLIAVAILASLMPDHVLYCPHCKKRVKAGADTCHHCGQNVLAS